MAEAQKYNDDEYQEIDLLALLKKLFSCWKTLLIWCAAGIVVGISATVSTPKTYVASTKMTPEATARNVGNYGAFAAMAGVNVGGMSTTPDSMQPTIYPDIVKSTPFIVELFPVPVTFKTKSGEVSTDMYDFFCNYYRQTWSKVIMSAPSRFIHWVKTLFKGKKEPLHGYEDLRLFKLTSEQSRVVSRIRESVSLSLDKKTYLINTEVETQNQYVSAILANEITAKIQKYVATYRTDKARRDLEYYQQLFDEAKQSYYETQQKYARYVDANQGVVLQRVRIEEERLRNEANLSYQIYNSCAQQLQTAKAKVQQETPVCSVIQPASVPLREAGPKLGMNMFVFAFLALCLGSVWVLWGKSWIADYKKAEAE